MTISSRNPNNASFTAVTPGYNTNGSSVRGS
jgi:hypothetical protein